MAFSNAHLYIRVGGKIGSGGLDHWSIGMRFGVVGADIVYDKAKLQTFVQAVYTAFATPHADAGFGAGSVVFIDEVTGARIGLDGKYNPSDQDTVRYEPATPVFGGGSTIHPWNTALVLSLRTAKPRGRASNGRIYYPALAMGISSSTGRVSGVDVNTRVTLWKGILDACNTAAAAYATNCRLVVASSVGLGEMERVTKIRSDERLDSIERRENDQAPTWHEQALALS